MKHQKLSSLSEDFKRLGLMENPMLAAPPNSVPPMAPPAAPGEEEPKVEEDEEDVVPEGNSKMDKYASKLSKMIQTLGALYKDVGMDHGDIDSVKLLKSALHDAQTALMVACSKLQKSAAAAPAAEAK